MSNVIGLDVFAGKKSVEWERATVERFDLVLVATKPLLCELSGAC